VKRRSFLRSFTEHRFGERALIKGVRGTAGSVKTRFGEMPVRGKHVAPFCTSSRLIVFVYCPNLIAVAKVFALTVVSTVVYIYSQG